MNKFTNPLNNLKIASPCSANWDEMVGDNRRRFCGECKLNVYNLSGMSKTEAENLIENSEGRLCVRFYKREDGTVLTEDCPVGWAAIKKRVSKTAAAFASLVIGLISGLGFTVAYNKKESEKLMGAVTMVTPTPKATPKATPKQPPLMGKIAVPRNTPKPKTENILMDEITPRQN